MPRPAEGVRSSLLKRQATRGLLAPGRTYADLAPSILIVQYHGYHSARPSRPREDLPVGPVVVEPMHKAACAAAVVE